MNNSKYPNVLNYIPCSEDAVAKLPAKLIAKNVLHRDRTLGFTKNFIFSALKHVSRRFELG